MEEGGAETKIDKGLERHRETEREGGDKQRERE